MMGEISPKTIRRVCAAEGYLELGMPAQALAELDAMQDPGPLAPHVNLLRGTSLMAQEHYEEAIEPLRQAVRTVPAPYNRLAWWSLSKCFQHEGFEELAVLAARFAESPPEVPQKAAPGIFVVIVTPQLPQGAAEASP